MGFPFLSQGRKNTAACHLVLTLFNDSSMFFGVEDIKTVPTSTLIENTFQFKCKHFKKEKNGHAKSVLIKKKHKNLNIWHLKLH